MTFKLIIEVDGEQHPEHLEADAQRTQFLERHGDRVLRFWNNEVLHNADAVLRRIAMEWAARTLSADRCVRSNPGKLTFTSPCPAKEERGPIANVIVVMAASP